LKFNKFILALIGLWLKTEEDVFQIHLMEIASNIENGKIFITFL
jgi:hypothetical protein